METRELTVVAELVEKDFDDVLVVDSDSLARKPNWRGIKAPS